MPTPAPRCKACSSADLIETNTQIRVRLAGLEGPNGAQIFLSMRALVCLDCGTMQAQLTPEDLRRIRPSGSRPWN